MNTITHSTITTAEEYPILGGTHAGGEIELRTRDDGLTPEMKAFLFNHYLKPKLEYRMKFIELTRKQLSQFDKWVNKTVADIIEEKVRTKTEAMQLVLGVQWPSEYYKITQVVALEKAANDETDMGKTSK